MSFLATELSRADTGIELVGTLTLAELIWLGRTEKNPGELFFGTWCETRLAKKQLIRLFENRPHPKSYQCWITREISERGRNVLNAERDRWLRRNPPPSGGEVDGHEK